MHIQDACSTDELSHLLSYVGDGVCVFGPAGLEYANQALADTVGYAPAQLLAPDFDWTGLIHPSDRQSVVTELCAHLGAAEPPGTRTFRVIRSDCAVRYLDVAFSYVPGSTLRVLGITRDVTTRRVAEVALQRHNRLLQGMSKVAHTLVGHFVTDTQVRHALELLITATEADRVALQIYRLPPSSGPSDMVLWHAGVAPMTPPQPFFDRWQAVFAQKGIIQAPVQDLPEAEQAVLGAGGVQVVLALPLIVANELRGFLRLDHLDASHRWDEADVAVLELVASTFAAALAHRETESRLEDSEERFRRLIENAPDVIYRMSLPEGIYEYISPAATEIFGATPEVLAADPLAIRQMIHPGWRSYFEDQWIQLLAGDAPPTYEYAIVHGRTGETRWLHQRNVLIRDAAGRVVAIEGIVADMTARRHAEIALRTREATLNSILRAAPIGIGLVVDRVIMEVNERLCALVDYTREELVGQRSRILYPTDEDYEFVGRVKYAQIDQAGTGSVETRWQRKDGTVLDILLSSSPLVYGNTSAGVTFTALDITERKQAEARIKAALREKEILLQEIHHRVKNNLALVSSLLGLQALHLADPTLDEPFNETRDRVHAMARLHEHLYKSSDVAYVEMHAYVTQLIDELRMAYGADVNIEVQADDVRLTIEQAMPCGLILSELITNALKHAFPDLAANSVQALILVSMACDHNEVVLMVQDNGVGLPEGLCERKGSMGCSLVRLLTQQLQGELQVAGEDGACISVRFPYLAAPC